VELSETCKVLSQKYISEISASSWFYYNRLKQLPRPGVVFEVDGRRTEHVQQKTTAGSAEDIFSTYNTPSNIHVIGCLLFKYDSLHKRNAKI